MTVGWWPALKERNRIKNIINAEITRLEEHDDLQARNEISNLKYVLKLIEEEK